MHKKRGLLRYVGIHTHKGVKNLKEKIINWLEKNRDKKWLLFADQLIYRFTEDNVSSIGSQLAYYAILSIFPFLIFLLNLVQFTPLASTDVLQTLTSVLPGDTRKMIMDIVGGIVNSSSGTLLSVSVFAGLWSASSGIMHLIKTINKAYDYKEQRSFIKLRLVSVFFTLMLAVVIVLVFGLLIFGEIIAKDVFSAINISSTFTLIWQVLRIVSALVALSITFTLLFMFGPAFPKGSRTTFKGALPGAIFTTIGWVVSSLLFSVYVDSFGKYSLTYGSLGGIIVFLIWLYISSIIVVLGGEVNATAEYFKINNWTYDAKKSFIRTLKGEEKRQATIS